MTDFMNECYTVIELIHLGHRSLEIVIFVENQSPNQLGHRYKSWPEYGRQSNRPAFEVEDLALTGSQ